MVLEIQELFNLEETIAKDIFEGLEEPWQALGKISSFILDLGKSLSLEEYTLLEGNVWVSKTAKVAPTAYIQGPAIIGHQADIRHCAYIRANVIVGERSVVGNSTEVKNVLLFNDVQVPHYNYVGDSILGHKAHMGAGSITSNVKSDKTNIVVNLEGHRIETGLRKFGALLGDGVEVGCNAVLNPGTIIGRHTTVYPLTPVRGCIGPHKIVKSQEKIVDKK